MVLLFLYKIPVNRRTEICCNCDDTGEKGMAGNGKKVFLGIWCGRCVKKKGDHGGYGVITEPTKVW